MADDALFCCDEQKLEEVRNSKQWMKNPNYFKRVKVSPSATMKMLTHANSGVERGIKQNGTPVEVMGLILGRPGVEDLESLVVTDVFPLPIDGAETKVLVNDDDVINYMIELGESLEMTRKERFMGWYHSHPFDVEVHSHCFLSATDVSTQIGWQLAEDPNGNPWLAIVVDPLRSLAKGQPEFGAFRVYPPSYNARENECPDGQIVADKNLRIERWGNSHDRYYTLEIEYYMSSHASSVMATLSENFLWMKTLSSTPTLEKENRERCADRITGIARRLNEFGMEMGTNFGSIGTSSTRGQIYNVGKSEDSALTRSTQSGCEMAQEHCQNELTQAIKYTLFGSKTPTESGDESHMIT